MSVQLLKASSQHKQVFRNLMQFYMYDFSEFIELDVEEYGLFAAYPHLDRYWNESDCRFPYLIKKADKFVGFVLVSFIQSEQKKYYSIAEFFVMKKYRREGNGRQTAKEIFTIHKGNWEVFQKETNAPAQAFWTRIIDEYTQGSYTERFEDGKRTQVFVT